MHSFPHCACCRWGTLLNKMGLKSDFAAACVTYADFDTDGSPGVSKTEITDWIVKNGASGS